MAIDNTYFGVWKVLKVMNPTTGVMVSIVVESATERATQEVSRPSLVYGTALPRVLNIAGAIAEIDIVSPLLVYYTGRSATTDIQDGLYLWDMWFDNTVISPTYNEDPGLIMSKAGFSVDANEGAKYNISLMGDANAIKSENYNDAEWFSVESPTVPDDYPLNIGYDGPPYRVATFYDIEAQIGSRDHILPGLIESINIEMNITTDDFAYIGAPDQRKVIGISGMDLNISGTMISSVRAPHGNEFGWQALNRELVPDYSVPPSPEAVYPSTWAEGFANSINGGITLQLRDGQSAVSTVNLLPNILGSGTGLLDDMVFSTSSLNISPGLLRTDFEGQAWIGVNELSS